MKTKTREYKVKRRERKDKRTTKNRQLENRNKVQHKSGLGYSIEGGDEQREILPPEALPEVTKITETVVPDVKQCSLIWKHPRDILYNYFQS